MKGGREGEEEGFFIFFPTLHLVNIHLHLHVH